MGFFSDLKEDLSQAVNELMPDENVEESDVTETADVVESNETVADDAETVEAAVEEAGGDSFDAELEKMLSELDEEEKVEEVADEDMSELLDTFSRLAAADYLLYAVH